MPITLNQYQEMLARTEQNKLRDKTSDSDAPPDPGREARLHMKILEECQHRSWIVIHSRMDRPTTLVCGAPDFIILSDQGRLLLVECKRAGAKLTVAQQGFAAWASRLGHTVFMVRSFKEFLQVADG